MTRYISKNRCKFSLKIHLILVCKYRKKLLINNVGNTMKQIIYEISRLSHFVIDVMEVDIDHLHILADISPTYSISSYVNRLKSISTNRIWKEHLHFLQRHFWKENTFWSDGYFVCSVGNAHSDTVRNYIETQG